MELWNEETYERLAAVLEPVHDELVERLDPRTGEAWLDVGSGTGSIALRAARAGADVSAIDSSASASPSATSSTSPTTTPPST